MRKNQIVPVQLESAMVLTDDISTIAIGVNTVDNVGFWLVTTGITNNTGTFYVEIRALKDENHYSPWVALTLDDNLVVANADVAFFINLNQLPPCQVRLSLVAGGTSAFDVKTVTFPTKAGSADGDYITVDDPLGVTWAVALDKTGLAANTPTGAKWLAVAASRKVYYDISAATSAASVAALVETAFNALPGFTAAITTDDTAADGTMLYTQTFHGPVGAFVPKNKGDTGAGTISVANGATGNAPDGTAEIWVSGTEI